MWQSLFRTKSIDKIVADAARAEADVHSTGLNKVLTVRDLTFFGIAAVIGAGSFSSMGEACFKGGPGVVFLFIICAVACGFAAMCYAEFASRIPVAGSAYTYAYASFGELLAWVIGWALLMEYSIGNIYVAFSWSDYFANLLDGLGLHLPEYLTCSYHEAHTAFNGHSETLRHLQQAGTLAAGDTAGLQAIASEAGMNMKNIPGDALQATMLADLNTQLAATEKTEAFKAWTGAGMLGSLRIILDLPAIAINALITYLVYRGVRESRNASNAMVITKLMVVFLVIAVGAFYVNGANWKPFMPNGFSGVMGGVSAVFFAFIGFDAVSTLAEESRNPQKDLPRGMLYSLIVCTAVYILLALVLTGMVSYRALAVGDPLAEVFKIRGIQWMLFFVSIAAVVAMTSVMLVFQMGQPRIWMSMSRDGLLPPKFASIHPRYKTPGFSTIVTGLVVGIPLLFTDKKFVLDFTSIGTLFAFVLVCGGVLLLPRKEKVPGKFNLPYINGKWIVPVLFVGSLVLVGSLIPGYFSDLFHITAQNAEANIPMIVFYVACFFLALFSFLRNLSLIPVLGLVSCSYLLTGMTANNWKWFLIWFAIGLVVYLCYGYRKSKLAR